MTVQQLVSERCQAYITTLRALHTPQLGVSYPCAHIFCTRANQAARMCIYKMKVTPMLKHAKLLLTENFETKAGVDLGTKYKNAGTLYKKKFDAPGRALDLEALWREKGSEVELAAVYKLDTQKKATVKYVSLTECCSPPASSVLRACSKCPCTMLRSCRAALHNTFRHACVNLNHAWHSPVLLVPPTCTTPHDQVTLYNQQGQQCIYPTLQV